MKTEGLITGSGNEGRELTIADVETTRDWLTSLK